MTQASQPAAAGPALPPNISIYTGVAKAEFLSATLFTRLATTAGDPAKLSAALSSSKEGNTIGSFCHQHHNAVLIFDGASSSSDASRQQQKQELGQEEKRGSSALEDAQDRHHEHFREICLRLKDADVGVQYGRCVFDAGSSLAAGFQLDQLQSGDIMVIDLQQIEDDEDDSEDDKDKKASVDDDDEEDDSDIDLATLGDVVSGSLS